MITNTGCGIYLAYPRSEGCMIAKGDVDTLVSRRHTKVGITPESFIASGSNYRRDFDNRVKFIPLVEIPAQRLREVEENVLAALASRYRLVGGTRNWFDTQQRDSIISLIYSQLCTAANDPGAQQA